MENPYDRLSRRAKNMIARVSKYDGGMDYRIDAPAFAEKMYFMRKNGLLKNAGKKTFNEVLKYIGK